MPSVRSTSARRKRGRGPPRSTRNARRAATRTSNTMDESEIKHVIEAALLAAGRPLSFERITELFTAKGAAPERATLKGALDALANDYAGRGIELKEVATGYRVQVKRKMG